MNYCARILIFTEEKEAEFYEEVEEIHVTKQDIFENIVSEVTKIFIFDPIN